MTICNETGAFSLNDATFVGFDVCGCDGEQRLCPGGRIIDA